MITIINMRKEKLSHVYDFKVDRTTPVGNQYKMFSPDDRNHVCDKYEAYFNKMVNNLTPNNSYFVEYLYELLKAYEKYGEIRLFCWCSPERCHAETIKRWLEKER